MTNKKFVTLSMSLLLASANSIPYAYCQGTSPASGDSDAWPWMVTPQTKTSGDSQPAVSAVGSSGNLNVGGTPAKQAASTFDSSTKASTSTMPKSETPHKEFGGGWGKLTPEKAETARAEFRSEVPATAAPAPLAAHAKSTMLYGRIEQLTASAGAQFPTLKAQTAKLDARGITLKAAARDDVFSGSVVKSFPVNFEGQYGGKLQLSMIQFAPLYYQARASEATQATKLLKQGMEGAVNVTMSQVGSQITLQPLQIYCDAPMADSRYGGSGMDSIPGMGNLASMGQMGQMMKTMMASMPYKFVVSMGNFAGTGLDGRSIQGSVVKETIHQLSPTVFEQDLVTTEQTPTNSGYSESVVRVTRYDQTRMFIQAASVDYTSDRRFLRKMLFQGYVTKGQVEQTMPMGGDMQSIQKMLPPGFNPFGGSSGGNSGGNTGNPFQGLFGQ